MAASPWPHTPRGRSRITSCPDPDRLELGCDRIWDECERILRRHAELTSLGEKRTARERRETDELWERFQELRAYSNFYREIVLRDALERAGAPTLPRLIVPRRR